MTEDVRREISRIKFQMRLLRETLDFHRHPVPSLVLELDWGEEELDAAHDIFERYSNQLETGSDVDWQAFESEFSNRLRIGYQLLKRVVLAFFRSHQWTRVCRAYAEARPCSEFEEIWGDPSRLHAPVA